MLFCRRVINLEGDLETCEDRLLLASQKLDKAATAADDSDRMRYLLHSGPLKGTKKVILNSPTDTKAWTCLTVTEQQPAQAVYNTQ